MKPSAKWRGVWSGGKGWLGSVRTADPSYPSEVQSFLIRQTIRHGGIWGKDHLAAEDAERPVGQPLGQLKCSGMAQIGGQGPHRDGGLPKATTLRPLINAKGAVVVAGNRQVGSDCEEAEVEEQICPRSGWTPSNTGSRCTRNAGKTPWRVAFRSVDLASIAALNYRRVWLFSNQHRRPFGYHASGS
jgi:hypothetical protein